MNRFVREENTLSRFVSEPIKIFEVRVYKLGGYNVSRISIASIKRVTAFNGNILFIIYYIPKV